MHENEFKSSECDKCIYYKSIENNHVIISLYMDDLLIFGISLIMIKNAKDLLCGKFSMKDLGEASVILRMKITRRNDGIFLHQSHYVKFF